MPILFFPGTTVMHTNRFDLGVPLSEKGDHLGDLKP